MSSELTALRRRVGFQRRALRTLNRAYNDLKLHMSAASARNYAQSKDLQVLRLAYDKFRGNYLWRVFGWRVHVWRNDWVLTFPPMNPRRIADLTTALRKFGHHAAGCTKFDENNRFHEDRTCSCGLQATFGKSSCQCQTCAAHRNKRHQALMHDLWRLY